jgi:mono/diheme cytochrome c family protein
MSRPWVALFALLLVTSACHRAKATPGEGLASLDAKVVAQGDSIFAAISCARCHGAKGVGGTNGPSLVAGAWLHIGGSIDEITQLIITGVAREKIKDAARTRAMNPRGGPANLTDEQARAVATYVYTISRAK